MGIFDESLYSIISQSKNKEWKDYNTLNSTDVSRILIYSSSSSSSAADIFAIIEFHFQSIVFISNPFVKRRKLSYPYSIMLSILKPTIVTNSTNISNKSHIDSCKSIFDQIFLIIVINVFKYLQQVRFFHQSLTLILKENENILFPNNVV